MSEKRNNRILDWQIADQLKCQQLYWTFLTHLKKQDDNDNDNQLRDCRILCKSYTFDEIARPCRQRPIVFIRSWFAFWMRYCHKEQLTLCEIGQILGNRHHSSIINELITIEYVALSKGITYTPEEVAMCKWLKDQSITQPKSQKLMRVQKRNRLLQTHENA